MLYHSLRLAALGLLSGGLLATAQAQWQPSDSGQLTTAAAAVQGSDEMSVVLDGHIVERLGYESYLFRDQTGEIRLDVDEEAWRGQAVGPETAVRLYGEVDRSSFGLDIWVKRIDRVE